MYKCERYIEKNNITKRMNEAHRNVLQRHFRQLSNDIMLTDDFIGLLYQYKIFEKNMIDLIKAEKTEGERVFKMLEMLPKRGPDAFDNFVNIIQNDYPWLGATLQSSLKMEYAKSATRLDSYKSEMDGMRVPTSLDLEPEPDIKTKVSTFVHKQFGQSKRISENDKKSIFRWMSQQLQLERKRVVSASSTRSGSTIIIPTAMLDAATSTEDLECDKNSDKAIHRRVQKICEKLHQLKVKTNNGMKPGTPDSTDGDHKNGKNGSNGKNALTPATLEMVLSDIDHLVEKVDKLESEINKCHVMLGDREKKLSLSLLIYDLSLTSRQKEKEIQTEKNKSEKMLNELYDFSKNVNRLEQLKHQMKQTIDTQEADLEKFKNENNRLREQVVKLEQLNVMHTEKQKTLENLRNMVRELQTSRDLGTESVRSVQTRMSNDSKTSSQSPTRRPIKPNQVRPSSDMNNIPFSTRRYGMNNSKNVGRRNLRQSVFKN